MRQKTRRGLTLLEVLISTAILAIIFLFTYTVTTNSSEHMQTHLSSVNLEDDCRRVMDAVERDLREAVAATVVQPGGFVVGTWTVSTALTFSKPEDTDGNGAVEFDMGTKAVETGATVTWSSGLLAEEGAAANGQDNNGNGLVDEAEITRAQGASVARLSQRGTSRWDAVDGVGVLPVSVPAGSIPMWRAPANAPAIYFIRSSAGAPSVTVVVSLQGVDARGRRLTRSLVSTVRLRNSTS